MKFGTGVLQESVSSRRELYEILFSDRLTFPTRVNEAHNVKPIMLQSKEHLVKVCKMRSRIHDCKSLFSFLFQRIANIMLSSYILFAYNNNNYYCC